MAAERQPRRAEPPALRRAGPEAATSTSGSGGSSAAGPPAPSWPSTRSCGASTAPTSRPRCTCGSSPTKAPPVRRAARRHRRERRRGRHRPGLRGHLQDRVAQPPVLRGAAPGRGHRRRRHRPRHPGHGRPPGRGDGRAAVRPGRRARHRAGCCPAWSAASRSTATAWACPTSAASSSSTPATRATRWSTRSAWGSCGTGTCRLAARRGPGNKVILFGAATGPDGIGGASVLASATFGDGSTAAAAKRPSVQVGDPFMEKLLVECCLELFAGGLVVGIQDLGAAGRLLRDHRAGRGGHRRHATSGWTRCRCATRRCGPRRDPDERVAGTHDGGRRARPTWRRSSPSAPSGTSGPP